LTQEEERVVLDRYLFNEICPIIMEPLAGYSRESEDFQTEEAGKVSADVLGWSAYITFWNLPYPNSLPTHIATPTNHEKPHRTKLSRPTDVGIRRNKEVLLQEEDNLLIMEPLINGFSLKKNMWGKLSLSGFSWVIVMVEAIFPCPC
jgi:hypothetical protein